MILRPLFCLKVQKKQKKQKKLFFNFFVNRNCNILSDSRKRAKILADNRKSHQPIETLPILPVTKTNLSNPLVHKSNDALLLKAFR